jgi:ABC-2 type transport system ATP-binding protein
MLRIARLSKVYLPPPWWLRIAAKTAADEPVEALRDVSLAVDRGEIVGLIGPNGAGKSTLIRAVAGLVEPTAGQVLVDGFDVVQEPLAAKRRLGLVLTDDRGLYWRLDGRWNLEFFGVLAGLPRPVARRRAVQALADAGLADRDRLVFGYSSGMRSRLNIARALVADPPVLVLDEPTRSLDPVASVEVNTLLRRLAEQGRAVLLSSHRLDEVAGFCDRIVVLVGGTVRYSGPPSAPGTASLADLLLREVSGS